MTSILFRSHRTIHLAVVGNFEIRFVGFVQNPCKIFQIVQVVNDSSTFIYLLYGVSPRDVAAESVAGSILDMGSRLMDRASAIQPTITIRPGKRMGIFVQHDVVFPHPYFYAECQG